MDTAIEDYFADTCGDPFGDSVKNDSIVDMGVCFILAPNIQHSIVDNTTKATEKNIFPLIK